jgi:hypothetical protein
MCKGIDMKNTLAENMLRFGVKNLNESNKDSLKALTEQSLVDVNSTGKPITVNLYDSKSNEQKKYAFAFATIIDNLAKLKFSNGGTKFRIKVDSKDYFLIWNISDPDVFLYFKNTVWEGKEVYNKNLSDDMFKIYQAWKRSKNKYKSNATYTQTETTPEPGDDQSVA